MQKETCGIYVITERATQRAIYVGQSIGIEVRWGAYKNRFPKDRFDYRIIQECPPAELNFWEKYYISALKTHWTEAGENQNWGGQHWPRPEEPMSPATREKISASLKGNSNTKGRVQPEEERAKRKGKPAHNKGKPGKPWTEEQKAKRRGKVQSEETRAKNSAANKGRVPPNKGVPMSEEEKAKRRGKTPANKGKPGRALTAEQRAKQSAAQKGRVPPNKGKPMSEEQRAKCSATMKGRPGRVQSEEERAKRSASNKGRVPPNKGKPMSEEQKKKLSEAVKARLALKRAAEAAAEIEAPEELLDSSSFNNLDTSVIT